jgi:hypothetical protein
MRSRRPAQAERACWQLMDGIGELVAGQLGRRPGIGPGTADPQSSASEETP